MTDQTVERRRPSKKQLMWATGAAALTGISLAWPGHAVNAAMFVIWGLVAVAPIVIPGIFLAAWIIASGADAHIAAAFEGKTL